MSISSSIRRLNLCSLSRLARMSETLSAEIDKLHARIRGIELECEVLAKDESSVILTNLTVNTNLVLTGLRKKLMI